MAFAELISQILNQVFVGLREVRGDVLISSLLWSFTGGWVRMLLVS